MKFCPLCHSNYSDDTLLYCVEDGTDLIRSRNFDTETPTVAFSETAEKFTTNKGANQIRFELPQNAWDISKETQIASIQPPQNRSNTLAAVLATMLGMLILFGGGIGIWFYFSKDQVVGSKESNQNTKSIDFSTPKDSRSNKTFPSGNLETNRDRNANAANTSEIDLSKDKQEVAMAIDSWKAASEAHNLDAHMNHYAEMINYYKKSKTSKSFVRSDRLKAYNKYPVIKISLSNMNVAQDVKGEILVAEFDKEWLFQNDEKSSTGKVKSELRFSKIDGQWKIVSERDLKVYFVK